MENYLSEAFKSLDILDEDVFEVDKDGLTALKDFEDKDEDDNSITVVDPDAESEEDLEDSYIGKVILDCSVCHTDIYKDKEDVVIDEESDLANIGEECPYCYSSEGFKVIGEVKPFVETTFETEDDVDVEVDGEEVEDEDMNESLRRHKKIVESKSRVGRKSLTESSNGKKKYIVTDIDYDIEEEDIDGEDFEHDEFGNPHSWSKEEKISLIKDNLPDRLVIYANSEDDIADEISNMTGWLVNDFDYKVEVEEEDESLKESINTSDIVSLLKKYTSGSEAGRPYQEFMFDNTYAIPIKDSIKHVGRIDSALKNDGFKLVDSSSDGEYFAYTKVTDNGDKILAGIFYNETDRGIDELVLQITVNPEDKELTMYFDESLQEDTVKQGKYWVNKGDEGTHGKFRTKKAADEQRKAMFAGGFKAEALKESTGEVFHNANGEDYEIIERSKSGSNALLNKGKQWIIAWNCPKNNRGSWGQGHYFFDEDEARELWNKKYIRESKNPIKLPGKSLKESCSINQCQKWVDYDMKKYKKISDDTMEKIKSSGYSVVKDQYGDYEVIADRKDESCGKKNSRKMKESIEDITIDTGDQEISVSARDKEKKSDGEMIAPLSDEMKADIEMNSDDVDVDVDEFSEEDFDELGESYLKKVYENVDSYRTTSAKTQGNKLFVEGLIKFNSGKEKKTSFVFESRTITKSGKAKLIGENLQISRGHKSFKLTGTINNGKFISESLNYNYRVKNGSESQRVYGTAKKSK